MKKCKLLKRKKQFKRGFTLIEVLLFLLVVLALVTILLSSAGTLTKTRSVNLQGIAIKIARQDIENLRKTNFNDIASGPITNPDLAKLPTSSATRTVTDYLGNLQIKQVAVLISWQESKSPTSIALDTLISKNGL
jgi:type II secretory pathway pseudopilin PulG